MADTDAAVRLKVKLNEAVKGLPGEESTYQIKHIIHDIAHLVSVYGERSLRQQYEDIVSLADDMHPSNKLSKCQYIDQSTPSCNSFGRSKASCESDPGSLSESYRDLVLKMDLMKRMIDEMHEQRRSEVEDVRVALERNKELLSESERQLLRERRLNQELLSRGRYECYGFESPTVDSSRSPNTNSLCCCRCNQSR
jgi:hypothetical protein